MPTSAHAHALVDLYLRLSVDREGKDSLERQEADLRAWADREGLTVRRVWADRGISGYKRDVQRPHFDAALAALRAGEAGTLAVWKLDRLSRRGAGQIGLVLDDVEHVGGRLVFLQDHIDTASGGNQRMLIVLLSEQARAESANTSMRVKAKKDDSRERGDYLGGPAPFGYVVGNGSKPAPRDEPPVLPGAPSDRKLRQHPDEAPLMREVVDRVLAGETLLAICRDWNAREVPTRRGGSTWRPSTLSAALRSPALAGLMPEKRIDEASGKWAASIAPWRHPQTGEAVSIMGEGFPPIVTESDRVRLLAMMDARLRRYGRGMKAVPQPASLLGGLIVCASCKRSANTFGNSYRCRRRHVDGIDCAAPLNVSVSIIESVVKRLWAQGLAAFEPDSPVLDAVAEHWIAKFDPAPLEERREVMLRLEDARTRLASADEDRYVRGTLDAARHARVTSGLEDRISGLTSRLRELPQPRADLGALLDPELSLPAIEAASVLDARALLRLAIRRVEVTAAPTRGARFVAHERVRVRWVGEPDH